MGNSNGIMNESPIPLYYQIYVDLKNKLLINKLVDENGKLPAEKELAESYKVSRVTMRQAIAELEKDGLIGPLQRPRIFLEIAAKPDSA